MNLKTIALATLLLALAPTTPALAQPQSAAIEHDVQCLLASAALLNADDPNAKNVGLMGAMFFGGQLFGADPDIDLTAALKSEAPKMTPDHLKVVLAACGAEMTRRGNQITAAGAALNAGASPPATQH
jgi:hypothetical protein